MIEIVLLSIFLILIMFLFNYGCKKPVNFPPGLPKLPILGSVPFMAWHGGKKGHILMRYLSETYGKVASAYMFKTPIILISDSCLVREAFKNSNNSDRVLNAISSEVRYVDSAGNARGLLFSNGEEWRDQRRFTMKHLKDLGMGKTSMEECIQNEIQKLSRKLEHLSNTEHEVVLNNRLNISIINSLWTILVGEPLDEYNEQLHNLIQTIDSSIRGMPSYILLASFLHPAFLRTSQFFKEIISSTYSIYDIVESQIFQHQKTLDEKNARDFIELYLKEIQNTTDRNSSFYGQNGLRSLKVSLLDLFIAGSETTSSSLVWTILYLLHYPEVQVKIHEEISHVLGSRTASMADRKSLPYTNAVLQESLRKTSLVFHGLPHLVTKSFVLGGQYFIPKNSILLANLDGIHHDQAYWEEPHKFKPERFLESVDGMTTFQLKDHGDHLNPFLVGKRSCLGKSLAETEMFLFFVGLMQRFNFKPVQGEALPNIDIRQDLNHGVLRCPPVFKVVLSPTEPIL